MWRLAGISRVNPVDVPTLLKLEMQSNVGLVSWRDPFVLGDEIDCAMGNRNSRSLKARKRSQN
jgi:hypothetical protein